MIKLAPAKINLGLEIIGKRKDGFHEIKSIFYPIDWFDVVEIVRSDANEDSFHAYGIEIDGNPQDNLVLKAVELIREDHFLPALKVGLLKNIPIGAGLGGGSSDASACLMLLNEVFNLNIAKAKLLEYAAKLGSDCPFFIHQQCTLVEGRGEIITPIELKFKDHFILVHYPDLHVSTKDAYSGLSLNHNESAFEEHPDSNASVLSKSPAKWMGKLHNHFEETIFGKYPNIAKVKETMLEKGAVYASMSGSGSAVYGIFKDMPSTADWTGKNWAGKL
ncbi:MAG: 4-(cytidine 5'-diphospho)-2-C-methyl-D-erythritol kinase [Flavobacteriales bacterium]